ncbi:unnamed protein product [Rangifer tarandus platyrhynchus]|uniref:Uncharacterized protein n=1 Tax=Rangifer tarandus platyrhynchus TaxID=3082113 RepID=A0AC59YA28_RANTA
MCQKPTENFWEGFRFPSTPFFLPTDVELKLEMEWPSCNRKCNKRSGKAPPYQAQRNETGGVRVTLSTKQDSCLCQEGELWLKTEDKPSQQPLAGLIRLAHWGP